MWKIICSNLRFTGVMDEFIFHLFIPLNLRISENYWFVLIATNVYFYSEIWIILFTDGFLLLWNQRALNSVFFLLFLMVFLFIFRMFWPNSCCYIQKKIYRKSFKFPKIWFEKFQIHETSQNQNNKLLFAFCFLSRSLSSNIYSNHNVIIIDHIWYFISFHMHDLNMRQWFSKRRKI